MREMMFLCHRIPYPPTKGDKIRAWHFFAHLARRFRTHLGCFIDEPGDWEHVAHLQRMSESVLCVPFDKSRQKLRALLRPRLGQPLTAEYFHHPRMRRWVDDTLARGMIDQIFVYSSGMAPYVMHHKRVPRVLERAPDAHLTIVGANPVRAVTALAGRHVTVTGRVDDIRPYVAHAAVVVAPLRIARGIQNKVLEAMAMGRPVVASPQAYEGIRAAPGRELLVGDGAREMAQAVVDVLDARHTTLAEAARRAMERGYSWQGMLDRLDALLDADVSVPAALTPGVPQ
jgi:hypothetical protein